LTLRISSSSDYPQNRSSNDKPAVTGRARFTKKTARYPEVINFIASGALAEDDPSLFLPLVVPLRGLFNSGF
jgi:hypothetical protein